MTRLIVVERDGTLVDFVRDEELGVVTPAFHPEQLRPAGQSRDRLRIPA